MTRAVFVALVAIASASFSCSSCRSERDSSKIVRDPVLVDARVDAAPPFEERVVADGRIVDLRKTALACKVADELPRIETSDGTRAYVVGRDGVLRVFDLGCTGELWHATGAACEKIAITDSRVWCATKTSLTAFPKVAKSPAGSEVSTTGESQKPLTISEIAQLVVVSGRLFVFHESGGLEIFEEGKPAPIATASFPIRPWGRADYVVTADGKGACGAVQKAKEFEVTCLDEHGAVRFTKRIVLAKSTDPTFMSFLVRANDGRNILISTLWSTTVGRAVVVRLTDGAEIARVEEEVTAVVTREDGAVEGLLTVRPTVRLLELDGTTRWTATGLLRADDSAVASMSGDRIFVVNFPAFSSGASPLAFDRLSGKLLWAGALEQLEIAHSAYLNRVTISLHATDEGPILAVRGAEAMITYLQLFDLRDGRRRYSQTQYVR